MDLPLSQKYRDFLRTEARVDFLEGSTASGKTTVGAVKFILQVLKSNKRQHIIAGLDLGTIEKNVLSCSHGLFDVFGDVIQYHPSGHGENTLPHLTVQGKVVYLLGYDHKARWKKALGGQYGCLFIDEINVADVDFMREAFMRCDYAIATLNPDNPALPVYQEYINHARPPSGYSDDAPPELLKMLDQPPKEGWLWWYFTFEHNASLSQEKRDNIIASVPVGTKLYKNKIQGLRGKATGLVFPNFDRTRHVVTAEWLQKHIKDKALQFKLFSTGVDTSYSSQSADTIAMCFTGITTDGILIVLDERTYNNRDLVIPLAPSDTIANLVGFLERNRATWGFSKTAWIDSADQATITEGQKYNRSHPPLYSFCPAWKKLPIIDRINLQLGWHQYDKMLVVDTCKSLIQELETYSWDEKKDSTPEDGNDHMINAAQYAWLPHKHLIGAGRRPDNGTDGSRPEGLA